MVLLLHHQVSCLELLRRLLTESRDRRLWVPTAGGRVLQASDVEALVTIFLRRDDRVVVALMAAAFRQRALFEGQAFDWIGRGRGYGLESGRGRHYGQALLLARDEMLARGCCQPCW